MTSLTLLVTERPGAGYHHELREGAPDEAGTVVASCDVPPLTADQVALLSNLREAVLEETGLIAGLDAQARQLGALLLPGAVGQAWKARIRLAEQRLQNWTIEGEALALDSDARREWAGRRPGCRTYLQIEAGSLAGVPWELARVGGTIFIKASMPVVRYVAVPQVRNVTAPGWQVRVLVVVAAEDPTAIEADVEVVAIKRALRPLDRIYDVDVLRNPTRNALTQRLTTFKPHVLHVIGHGTGDSLQLFDGASNVAWGETAIANDIGAATWIPDVAYLNACRSQGGGDTATAADVARQDGIVRVLFEQGVMAVVAMQADVRGESAARCASTFYAALLSGEPIDMACAHGRAAIARAVPAQEDGREPYVPVLTLAARADEILRHRAVIDLQQVPIVSPRLQLFVDRFEDRRQIVRAIDEPRNAIILQGSADIGKSWLLAWTIDLFLRRRHHVRYLELGACTDWLHVLRSLRDGNRQHPGIQSPLGALLDDSFNWRLSHLARGIVSPPDMPAGPAPDDAGTLDALQQAGNAAPDFEERVCRAFHDALELTADRPLVLVFDQLEAGDHGLSADQFRLLREHWLDPLVARGDGRVRLVLGARSDRLRDYGLDQLPLEYRAINVAPFSQRDLRQLVEELIELRIDTDALAQGHKEILVAALRKSIDKFIEKQNRDADGRRLASLAETLFNFCLDSEGVRQ